MKKLIQIVLFVLSLGINTNTTFSQTMIEENSPARLRLNGMFSHFNQGLFGGNNWFSMPGYPLNPRRFQLGLSIDFAN